MGIRLDWESDSARSGNKDGSYVAREDPAHKRARARARTRFLITLIVAAMLLGGIGAIITWRLNEANAFIESLLRDTVESEFAALRIGDWNAFAAIQRSATDDWTVQQRTVFDNVQQQKQQGQIELTGTVRGVEIDGTRGRVMVEWVEEGTPVTHAWFYWRYEDGWRHVPADLTFWGEATELRGNRVTVAHRTVDAPLAKEMGVRVESWISAACGPILQCGDVPHITLDVRPDLYLTTGWDNTQPWRLLIPSPFVNGARTDAPFSGDTLVSVAEAIAARLVSLSLGTTVPFDRTTDAGYLVTAAGRWLFGEYISVDADSTVIDSLASSRGPAIVGQLLKSLTPDSKLQAVLDALGVTGPEGSGIDWSDFVRARIQLESDLITQGSTDGVAALYIEEMQSRALERTQAAAAQSGVEVTLVQSVTAPDGSPALIASVILGSGPEAREETIYFYWRDGTWLRAS
jgi:hypothetical protein